MIKAGCLKHRVTLQNPTKTRSASGSASLGWGTVATVWACVRGMSGRDVIMAAQAQALVTHKVTIRYRNDVNSQTRLLYDGRVFEVVVALERSCQTGLELLCREVEDGLG